MWYEDSLVILELKNRRKLPFHRFKKGDGISLSGGYLEGRREGSVAGVSSKWIRIAVPGEIEGDLTVNIYLNH